MEDALRKFLETGKDWEKMETDIDGVFVVKIPATKTRDAKLMVEVNPINKTTGQPKKRKGLFIADFEMYLQFQEALMEDEVPALIKTIEGINPQNSGNNTPKKLKLKD
ncbi:MAG: hypothetical protein ACTSWX_01440 [Promethearchaeota archaeon]